MAEGPHLQDMPSEQVRTIELIPSPIALQNLQKTSFEKYFLFLSGSHSADVHAWGARQELEDDPPRQGEDREQRSEAEDRWGLPQLQGQRPSAYPR